MRSFLLIFCVVFGVHLDAQEYYKKEVIETSIFDSTEATALRYDIQLVDKAAFQKLWKKEMSKYSEGDFISNELQTIMFGVIIPGVSKDPFTTYLNLKTINGGLELVFALKDSVQFVDLNTSSFKKDIEAYFEDFILKSYVDKLNSKLKAETSNLDAIDSDIKKNYKEIAKNDKFILKLESEIENTKKQVENHDSRYDAVLTTIEESKTELATTPKEDENYKVVKKEVKNLEKNKKTMETDHLKNKELIYDDEAEIVLTKKNIKALEDSIASLEERKITQKQDILDLEEEIYSLTKP